MRIAVREPGMAVAPFRMVLLALAACGLVLLSAWKRSVSCEQANDNWQSPVTVSEGETGQAKTPPRASVKIDGVESVGMTVSDMGRAIEFYTSVLIEREIDAAPKYMRTDYIQHNTHVPTGLKGFMDTFRERFAQKLPPDYNVSC